MYYPPTLVHGICGGRARREGERSWEREMKEQTPSLQCAAWQAHVSCTAGEEREE
jgi:hypothetical protein